MVPGPVDPKPEGWPPPPEGWPTSQPTGGEWAPPQMPAWGYPQAPSGQPSWPPPPPPPPEVRDYLRFWRSRKVPWWKPLIAIVVGGIGFVIVAMIVTAVGVAVDASQNEEGILGVIEQLSRGEVSKILFVANSIALGLMVPLAFLLQRIVGQRPGALSAVTGRLRWGWLWICLGVSLAALVLYMALAIVVDGWASFELSSQPDWLWLLIAIIVITPFQSAGEEYLIRGVLNRAVASWIPNPRAGVIVAAIVSSIVFALMHAAADPWLNLTYFSMGLLFSYLVWRTGGLEAAIAMHTANNLVGLGMLPFQEWGGIFDRSAGVAGPEVLLQLFFLGGAALLIVFLTRKRQLTREATLAPIGGTS